MNIAVGLVGYECAEHLKNALAPWLELKKRGHNIFISLVHGIFPETYSLGYPVLSTDGSHILMEELKLNGEVDHVQICVDPLYEYQLRNLNVEAAKASGQNFYYFWLLDHDEKYTIEEIEAAYKFAEEQEHKGFEWFKINFQNYVIKKGCWVDDFSAPRIWNFSILDKFYYDNEVLFTNGEKASENNGTLIPKEIGVFPRHDSWLGSKSYLQRKIMFQRVHYSACSYKWNNSTDSLDFDYNYYFTTGKEIPILHYD